MTVLNNNILYIYYIPSTKGLSGVMKKLLDQAESSKEDNLRINFLLLTSETELKINLDNIYIENLPKTNYHKKTKAIVEILDYYSKRFNVFFIRKMTYIPLLLHALKTFKDKYKLTIINDHQTKEIPEYKNGNEGYIIKLLLEMLEKKGIRYINRYNLLDGIVATTREILNYEQNLYKCKNGFVMGNGMRYREELKTGFATFDGNVLKLVMSIGQYYPWHGLERLIKSMELYRNYITTKLVLIAGKNSKRMENIIRKKSNIELYINPTEDTQKAIYRFSNLAVSSLSLHKKSLKEASPLKSREYMQRGIPFIYAYYDTDISNSAISNYFIKIKNDDSIINLEKVVHFLEKMGDSKEITNKITAFAKNELSWGKKLKSLENFIREIKNK